jgi:hypothetical protein
MEDMLARDPVTLHPFAAALYSFFRFSRGVLHVKRVLAAIFHLMINS